jgi:uncharacterized membrane protein YqjE
MPGWFNKSGSQRDPSNDEGAEGSARDSSQAFRDGLEDHLKARAELFGIEAREAGNVVARKGVLGLVVAALLFFSYALLLSATVSLLGRWLETTWPDTLSGIGWQLVALSVGVPHLLVALTLFKKLKRKPDQPLFEYTRTEFQKDRKWLKKRKTSENDNSR